MNRRSFYRGWFFIVFVTLGLAFSGMTSMVSGPAFGAENLITDGTFTGEYKTSSNNIYIIWGPSSTPSGFLDTAETTWAYATTDLSGNPATFGYYLRPNQSASLAGSTPSVGNTVGIQVFQQAGKGEISQTVNGLEPGKLYITSYEYNARNGNTVSISSSITGASEIPLQNPTSFGNTGSNPFRKYSGTFTADSSSAVLSIVHTSNEAADRTLFVGNISLTLSPAQPIANLVQDGSFENGSYTYAAGHGEYVIWGFDSPTSGNFESTGLWKYETSSTSGFYLRPQAGQFVSGSVPDGKYVAAIQSFANPVTASLYQEIATTPGKTYAVSAKYNARPGDSAELSVTAEGATATKTFLDRQLVTANASSNYTFAGTFTASDAMTKLRFTNTINGGTDADRTVTIDKVQMVEVPSKIVEAGGTLVHALDAMTAQNGGYGSGNVTTVPYTYDASDTFSGAIYDRVGYYVELVDKTGNFSYAHITMDPFSADVKDLGLPTGAAIAGSVRNLTVESNVEGLSRTGSSGGRIEFGRGDYQTGANGVYDYWDTGFANANGYGTFQIHDADTKTTIFSFCGWGRASNRDAGIGLGNSAGGNKDWTFSNSLANGNYVVANIYSYIHESDAVLNPTGPCFFQRDAEGNAAATISGSWQAIANDTIASIKISENGTDWTDATLDAASKTFSSAVTLGTGWHAFQIQAFDAAGNLVTSASTGKIGVGDVLVAAGKTDTRGDSVWATSGNVVTFDPVTGKIALTGGNTPWAETGEYLTKAYPEVPVAFVDATTNDQTQALALLQSTLDSLDGETAVLWLQDGTAVTSDQLREKIQGNEDISWVLGSASNAEVPQMAELADSLENASAGPLSSQYGTLGALGQAWGYAALTGPYQVPEPSTLVLLVFGLAVFGWKRACY